MSLLPPKPDFDKAIYRDDLIGTYYRAITEVDFNQWYDREIKPLFENAVEVYSQDGSDWIENVPTNWATHTALLINIQPVKEDTAEDILRELMEASELDSSIGSEETNHQLQPVLEKARKYLEKKK